MTRPFNEMVDEKGVEFGDQSTNGKWRLKPSSGNMVLSCRVSGVWIDTLSVTPAGIISVLGKMNIPAGANLDVNGGMKIDGDEYLQLFGKATKGIKICETEDTDEIVRFTKTSGMVIDGISMEQEATGTPQKLGAYSTGSFSLYFIDGDNSHSKGQGTSGTCYWTKIGNIVILNANITSIGISGLSGGNIKLGNFPFVLSAGHFGVIQAEGLYIHRKSSDYDVPGPVDFDFDDYAPDRLFFKLASSSTYSVSGKTKSFATLNGALGAIPFNIPYGLKYSGTISLMGIIHGVSLEAE